LAVCLRCGILCSAVASDIEEEKSLSLKRPGARCLPTQQHYGRGGDRKLDGGVWDAVPPESGLKGRIAHCVSPVPRIHRTIGQAFMDGISPVHGREFDHAGWIAVGQERRQRGYIPVGLEGPRAEAQSLRIVAFALDAGAESWRVLVRPRSSASES